MDFFHNTCLIGIGTDIWTLELATDIRTERHTDFLD